MLVNVNSEEQDMILLFFKLLLSETVASALVFLLL